MLFERKLDSPSCISGYRSVWNTLQLENFQVPRQVIAELVREDRRERRLRNHQNLLYRALKQVFMVCPPHINWQCTWDKQKFWFVWSNSFIFYSRCLTRSFIVPTSLFLAAVSKRSTAWRCFNCFWTQNFNDLTSFNIYPLYTSIVDQNTDFHKFIKLTQQNTCHFVDPFGVVHAIQKCVEYTAVGKCSKTSLSRANKGTWSWGLSATESRTLTEKKVHDSFAKLCYSTLMDTKN